jgi:hypothetical protein
LGLSESTFKKMIIAGTIHGTNVTLKDIEIANDIYGQSIPSLKGRMVNNKIKDVTTIKIPNMIEKIQYYTLT